MIGLIITANDELYDRLASKALADGQTPRRAMNVLDGFKYAMAQPVSMIVVDMSLHASDTLVEALHSRRVTCNIPLFAVRSSERLPFQLRRLCTDVLETGTL